MTFAGLLNQTVSVSVAAGKDRYGNNIPGTQVELPARVEYVSRTRLTASGDPQMVDATIMLNGDPGYDLTTAFFLDGTKYRMVSQKKRVGKGGQVHHVTYEVARWN
jgi:hypothetical protein